METMQPKRGLFVSLSLKMLILFTLVFSVIFAVAFFWFYRFATDMALERITQDMVITLQGAAGGVDGDELATLFAEGVVRDDGYTDDPRFWAQIDWLATVTGIEPRAALYTYRQGPADNELIFITSSGAAAEPPWGATFRESWITDNPGPNLSGLITTTLQDASSDGCPYSDPDCTIEPYGDDFGTWVSAFTPIFNAQNEVVAAMGVDFDAEFVHTVQEEIRRRIVIAFGITYLGIFAVVWVITQFLNRPIQRVTMAARDIAEGEYDRGLTRLRESGLNFGTTDEVDILSSSFAGMVNKIYQREQTLKKQVEELRIEIDESKQRKQVSEITDTAFFQDLKTRVRSLRERNLELQEGSEGAAGSPAPSATSAGGQESTVPSPRSVS
jgi:hypothetical protein